ncbi:MAG: MFS transporter [Anaerolineae bacterium]|nr:MFS transporter [Anaerolineae bacterium]
MNLSRNLRLLLFATLYAAQGAVMSHFLTFNILYLGEAGYGPDDIGIFQAILVLPFILKIFLGMLSDAVDLFGLGHRKPYILIGLIAQATVILVAPYISVAEGLGAYAALMFVGAVAMATYDTCTDGLALDTTPESERGLVQGIMTGARAGGILVMLVVGGWLAENLGWPAFFLSLVVLTLIPLPLALLLKEDPRLMRRQKFQWSAFRAFTHGGVMLVALMGLLYSFSLDGVLTFLSDHLRAAMDVSVGSIGLLVALSMLGRVLGAASNGWLTDRIGPRQSLLVGVLLAFVACIGLALSGHVALIAIFGLFFGLAYGYYTSVYAAVAMDFCDEHILASMFATFMLFVNVGTAIGQPVGGLLAENLGFGPMALIMGTVNLINVALVLRVFGIRKRDVAAGVVE